MMGARGLLVALGQLQSPFEDPSGLEQVPCSPLEALSPQALAPIKGPQGSQRVLEGSWPQGRRLGPCPITQTAPVSPFSPFHSAVCFLSV